MKHILHLYSNLMNLYGDWGNVAVLEHRLNNRGIVTTVDKINTVNEVDFNIYDFIYIGSGTENSLLACMQDIKHNKDALLAYIESNKPMLVTGNSHEIFGKTITDYKGTNHKMLGLLEFETIQENTRITGDCKAKVLFMEDNVDPIVGFINRAGGKQIGNIERPFFIEPLEGAHFQSQYEGIKYKNLLGTYLTGPLLVRNQILLQYFTDMIDKLP